MATCYSDGATTWTSWTSATASASTTHTWGQWADNGTVATSASTWGYWMDTGTTVSESSVTIWVTWNEQTGRYDYLRERPQLTEAQREELRVSEAERQARYAEENRRYQAKEQERRAKLEAAKAKAEELLLQHLTPEQEQAWKENRAIFVRAQSGKRYKIKDGRAHNVFEVDEQGQALRELCVHVEADCPNADNVLAQKLALLTNEAAFLKRANIWDLTQVGRPIVQRSS